MKRTVLAVVAACVLTPVAAHAERRMFSYDPISPDAKRLTGAGLTVLFEQGMMGNTRPMMVLATGVAAQGVLIKANAKDLSPKGLSGLPGVDADAVLFEIDPKAEEGRVYLRAFCPGSKRIWLSFSRIVLRRDLRIQAFGDDPKGGPARVCGTLDFSWRGEWRLPNGNRPDPMEDWTDSLIGVR